jgi:hypothetical protein
MRTNGRIPKTLKEKPKTQQRAIIFSQKGSYFSLNLERQGGYAHD